MQVIVTWYTLKMTSAQVVETSVTNNSSFLNYPHPDDHTIRATDTPGFKPFILMRRELSFSVLGRKAVVNQPSSTPTQLHVCFGAHFNL